MKISFNVPDEILHQLLDAVPIPELAAVRQDIETPPAVEDVGISVRRAVAETPLAGEFKRGERIAIAVGSRGIAHLPEMVAALVAWLKDLGTQPFIVPAMGSHGGATAEGQREVLAFLGVTEERVGAPVESQMETVIVGHTPEGVPVQLDRLAAGSDGVVLVARVKPHTAFRGPYESGLAKMLAIGLGKQAGAAVTHARGFGEMARMVPAMAGVALRHAPVRFGLATLENAYDRPFKLVAVPAQRILEDEPALLDEARAAMPNIPFDQIDVLVIDRIGKNISGDGADPNITGRYPTPFASGGPSVNKQVVLDLADESAGNANGVGTADFTTVRLAQKMSLAATYPNSLTSTVPGPVKLPMVLPSDRLALAAALMTCHAVGREPRLVRIADTLHLSRMWISPALLTEIEGMPGLHLESPPEPPAFDGQGNLRDLRADAVGAAAASLHADPW